MSFLRKLFGKESGVTRGELQKLLYRSKFSDYLPWQAYEPDSGMFVNQDDTIGFIWECYPLSFAGEQTSKTLEGLFRVGLPHDSVIQMILYADENIEWIVDMYQRLKTRESNITRETAQSYADYLLSGKRGLKNLGGIPLRNFRLFVAVKIPINTREAANCYEIAHSIQEKLHGAHLSPRRVNASSLLDWMRRFLNDTVSSQNALYDTNVEIRKQVIKAETTIKSSMDRMQVGDKKHMRCMTVKTYPREVNLLQTNELFGGVWGMTTDSNQITAPFLYSLNIVFPDMKLKMHAKCNWVMGQQTIASLSPSLRRMQEEYQWAIDQLEKGEVYVRVFPTLWVWGDSEDRASEIAARARRVWESSGYFVQEDRGILVPLFISSLPFGLYNTDGNMDEIDRDFPAPAASVLPTLPVQADFCGGGEPHMLFVGRKGQLITLDLFGEGCNNSHLCIMATSGSGKSFLNNEITSCYYGSNALIRIVDIGGSYKKNTAMYGAKYLDFDPESNICINPFSTINGSNSEDLQSDLQATGALVMQMCYSATDIIPPENAETDASLIKGAVRWAWQTKGNEADIDTVYEYLNTFPRKDASIDLEDSFKSRSIELLMMRAHVLAFNLTDFTRAGLYGRWFNGKSNFDISEDDYVVLELERLRSQKELFRVVTLQVMTAITQNLYLSDRGRRKLILFDEAHLFMKDGNCIKDIINEAYRRGRKYNASVGIVTQSILDIKLFGEVGQVIWGNSAFKFFLESEDFEKARSEKLIDYDDFTFELLKSVKSNKPYYSEIFIDSPYGQGIARLTVDLYKYFVNTSDAKDISAIESIVSTGVPYEEAIKQMVARRLQSLAA